MVWEVPSILIIHILNINRTSISKKFYTGLLCQSLAFLDRVILGKLPKTLNKPFHPV